MARATVPARIMSRQKRCRQAAYDDDSLTPNERVCEELRAIQWKSNCSTATLQDVLDALHGRLGSLLHACDNLPRKATKFDKKMQSMVRITILFCCQTCNSVVSQQQAGEKAVFLHGCVGQGCSKVWGPEDAGIVCDLCGGRRYDDKGKALESVVHFPLKQRLAKKLKCDQYYQAARWECDRERTNDDYMTGMYCYLLFVFNIMISCEPNRCIRLPCVEGIDGTPQATRRPSDTDSHGIFGLFRRVSCFQPETKRSDEFVSG